MSARRRTPPHAHQASGAIINCSSLGGLVGHAGRASYHASKHGVIGLTKSAAMDYAPRGIRINAVCPGVIATPMNDDLTQNHQDRIAEIMRDQPIGRLGRAEEVAAAVLWLASPAASFIHGVALPVDGGFTAHGHATPHHPPAPVIPGARRSTGLSTDGVVQSLGLTSGPNRYGRSPMARSIWSGVISFGQMDAFPLQDRSRLRG